MPKRVWARAEAIAQAADVALVITSRSIRGPLPVPVVVDHVDALSLNMRHRSRTSVGLPERAVAGLESRLLRRWEQRVSRWSTAQIAVSDVAASALPDRPDPAVIPAAWDEVEFEEAPGHVRDIDCIFTGDMRYPPNRDGARWLAADVLPLIRLRLPSLRAVFVGRGAAALRVKGVEIASDVPDVAAYLRRAKVALIAAEGFGSPFKTLEAAANRTAIVSRAWAVDCYGMQALRAETAEEFAAHTIALLQDDELRRRWAGAALSALDAQRSSEIARRFEFVLAAAALTVHSSDS